MVRPHPGGPLAALEEVHVVVTLTAAVSEAARDPRPDAVPYQIGASAAVTDRGLRELWEAASDGARRDVMTTVAQLAASHGADPAGLEPLDGVDRDLYLVGQFATDLLELATEELADDRERSLLPEAPWEQATGPTGIYAMSTVCDSSEPETAKLAATVALAAAAQRVVPASRQETPADERD